MVEETAEALRAEIDRLKRLALLVTDARVRAEIQKMIDEVARRLREHPGPTAQQSPETVRLKDSDVPA